MVESIISKAVESFFVENFNTDFDKKLYKPTRTKREHKGDYTVVVFPFLKKTKQKPVDLANQLGEYLKQSLDIVSDYNVIAGFLNLTIDFKYWKEFVANFSDDNFIINPEKKEKIVIEFSSPNTNKPLHLGHIRNNLLGLAVSNLLKYVGNDVIRVSLLNDRGIHICKTMYAWEKWGNKITPEEAGKKGDHLIGDLYVKFEQEYKKEVEELIKQGIDKEQAKNQAPSIQKARELLAKWEKGDEKTVEIWRKLNSWVLKGFDDTYKKLGVEFDKIYFESETYLLGKSIIQEQLEKGTVKKADDGSVYIDLTDAGLDKKILLRSDGTSVYITQDIGTAIERYKEFAFDKQIYVVGNEQIYHFKVLKEILKRFGYEWYDRIIHYSYGMVELPEGKMKSREGKVVDADDLIEEMYLTAKEKSAELGKLDGLPESEVEKTVEAIAMGALKYFILKVDPTKNMMFNPNESIDFNGNTGPFIQYTYTRIRSMLRKSGKKLEAKIQVAKDIELNTKEIEIIKEVYDFKNTVKESAKNLNPAALANYLYSLSKLFNSYYQEVPILKADKKEEVDFRLKLSYIVGQTIKEGLGILGISVPEQM